MADGTVAAREANLDIFYQQMNELVDLVDDKTQLRSFRELMLKNEREQRKAERKLWAERVDGLLSVLVVRGLRLNKVQERRLRRKALADLPPFEVAVNAADVADFAARAGLANGEK